MLNNIIKVNFNKEDKEDNFNKNWVKLLVDNEEDKQKEFDNILNNSKNEILGIMKFRRLEMERRIGQDITVNDLKLANAYDNEYLQSNLQNLFLEPILQEHMKTFKREIKRKKIDINDALDILYNKHLENKGRRFLSIVLTL